MIYAYFNDCLPRNLTIKTYANALEQTARGLKSLYDKMPEGENIIGGIITNSEISQYLLDGNNISLEHCLKQINDRDLRSLLFSWMTNYPETAFFKEKIDDEAILSEDYHLIFDDDKQNAINLILAKINGAFLLSLNLHKVLGVSSIEVQGNNKNVAVDNLYGKEKENINFIAQVIKSAYKDTLDTQQQIEAILQKFVKHNCYDTEYSKLSNIEQNAILKRWKEAKEKSLLNPFMPDKDVIKKTEGPEKQERNIGPVYELRVRKPRELRVYFQYENGIYYLLDIKDKTHQSLDIKNAFAKANLLKRQK